MTGHAADERSAFDWAQESLIPVHVQTDCRGAVLSAAGQRIRFEGDVFRLGADGRFDAQLSVADQGLVVLTLEVQALDPMLLRRVSWFAGQWESSCEQAIQSTPLMDNVLFLRKGEVSFILALDFPFSRIDADGISYPPHERMPAGGRYVCHTLSIGACHLSGERVGDFDRAEMEAVSAYVECRYPPRFQRPLFVSTCITNRMTDCRDGRVFYSMIDNPTLYLNPRLLEEDVRLCGRLGIEYFQVFEGVFDWPDQRKTGAALRRLQRLAKRVGVRLGDYANLQGLHCWHYNYEQRAVNRPEWQIVRADGSLGRECLGCPPYVESFRHRLVEHNREYGLELICLDFLAIEPCFSSSHGHEPGDVYQQIRTLVGILQELAALSPEFLVWSNSGNWLSFMPKLVWFNPNVYLTDPHARGHSSHLNVLQYLGDVRREQMVSVHESHGVPYRAFCNCEYYLSSRSRVPDSKVFEYSFLQGLAVTPNICPAEVRTFFNRIPGPDAKRCEQFMRHWIDFVRENYDVWTHTARVGDAPGAGAAEIYAHIRDDHGFLCLVNQNPFPRVARFRLDRSIGLSAGEHFTLREVYPRECLIAEQRLPCSRWGDALSCPMPARSVRVIEVSPAEEAPRPAVFGLPARVKRTRKGYRLLLRAPQGRRVPLAVALPEGEAIETVKVRQTPTVPLYTFPAAARVCEQVGNLARLEVEFPREPAPRELCAWHMMPDDVCIETPLPDRKGFRGAFVHNAFSEDYEVQVDLEVEPTSVAAAHLPPLAPPAPAASRVDPPRFAGSQTYVTRFSLPFIERRMPPGYDDDAVVELVFSDPNEVRDIQAWLNAEAVPVQRYRNPLDQRLETLFIELTGNVEPGPVELKLSVEWDVR